MLKDAAGLHRQQTPKPLQQAADRAQAVASLAVGSARTAVASCAKGAWRTQTVRWGAAPPQHYLCLVADAREVKFQLASLQPVPGLT
jgi:hypothetical protein